MQGVVAEFLGVPELPNSFCFGVIVWDLCRISSSVSCCRGSSRGMLPEQRLGCQLPLPLFEPGVLPRLSVSKHPSGLSSAKRFKICGGRPGTRKQQTGYNMGYMQEPSATWKRLYETQP